MSEFAEYTAPCKSIMCQNYVKYIFCYEICSNKCLLLTDFLFYNILDWYSAFCLGITLFRNYLSFILIYFKRILWLYNFIFPAFSSAVIKIISVYLIPSALLTLITMLS